MANFKINSKGSQGSSGRGAGHMLPVTSSRSALVTKKGKIVTIISSDGKLKNTFKKLSDE